MFLWSNKNCLDCRPKTWDQLSKEKNQERYFNKSTVCIYYNTSPAKYLQVIWTVLLTKVAQPAPAPPSHFSKLKPNTFHILIASSQQRVWGGGWCTPNHLSIIFIQKHNKLKLYLLLFYEYFGVNVLPPGSVSFKNGRDPPSVPSPVVFLVFRQTRLLWRMESLLLHTLTLRVNIELQVWCSSLLGYDWETADTYCDPDKTRLDQSTNIPSPYALLTLNALSQRKYTEYIWKAH